MPTVTIEYAGVEGRGKNVTAAKADALRRVERALAGDWTPAVLHSRGEALLISRDAFGWTIRSIMDGGKMRTSGFGSHTSYPLEDNRNYVEAAAYQRLWQDSWTPADGADFPPTEPAPRETPEIARARADFLSWCRIQLRFNVARRAGLNPQDSHEFAGYGPRYQDIIAANPSLATGV